MRTAEFSVSINTSIWCLYVEGYVHTPCPVTPSVVTTDVVNAVSGTWRAIQLTWKQARTIDEWIATWAPLTLLTTSP